MTKSKKEVTRGKHFEIKSKIKVSDNQIKKRPE